MSTRKHLLPAVARAQEDRLGDRKQLLEDGARPVIMWNASASCWHPCVKGFRPMVDSLYSGSRFEDVWLDK